MVKFALNLTIQRPVCGRWELKKLQIAETNHKKLHFNSTKPAKPQKWHHFSCRWNLLSRLMLPRLRGKIQLKPCVFTLLSIFWRHYARFFVSDYSLFLERKLNQASDISNQWCDRPNTLSSHRKNLMQRLIPELGKYFSSWGQAASGVATTENLFVYTKL